MYKWTVLLAPVLTIVSVASASAEPPESYLGGGVRAGLNDGVAAALNSKFELADLGELSISVRPGLLLGTDVEARLPLTLEGSVGNGFSPYAGAGLAYNTDGLSAVDPMLTAGVDVDITERLVFDVELNVIFQTTISDTDTELVGSLNYRF